MPELNHEKLAIEELRRRAKDNKAKNVVVFSTLSESYLDKTRNILFLISFAVLGYLGAVQSSLSTCQTVLLLISIVTGVLSYFFSYRYAWTLAKYYSALEHNLRTAFPSQEQYEEMLLNEGVIDHEQAKRHLPQFFTLIFLAIQVLGLFSSLFVVFL